jgi:hypothetical protein
MKTDGYQYQSEWMKQNFAEGEAKEGKAHGLGWSAARAENVACLSCEGLERLIVRISAERRWRDDA